MRKIKFRAWSKLAKRMYLPEKGCDLLIRIDGKVFVDIDIKENIGISEVIATTELMQFIGLKDKNGKEVYEGDIIEFENQGKYVIIYREDSAMFYVRPTTNGEQIPIWLEYSKQNCPYVVSGNIYENPELLK